MPSKTPSNSTRFHQNKPKSMSAFEISSTNGAETTIAKSSPAWSPATSATMMPLRALITNAMKMATSAPQKNAVAKLHGGSGAQRSIQPASATDMGTGIVANTKPNRNGPSPVPRQITSILNNQRKSAAK